MTKYTVKYIARFAGRELERERPCTAENVEEVRRMIDYLAMAGGVSIQIISITPAPCN